MKACHSVVCCAHGRPCLMGHFKATFEGLQLSGVTRRRESETSGGGGGAGGAPEEPESEPPHTAWTGSLTARSRTATARSVHSASSIYENAHNTNLPEEYPSAKTHSNKSSKRSTSRRSSTADEKSYGKGIADGAAVKVYIGVRSSDDAESIVTRATDFKMYHLIGGGRDIDSLNANLPLYIVYRTTKGRARHIPIKTVVQNKRRFLYAGKSADNKNLLFESIDALVKYYKTYVQLQPQGKTGMVDVFPA